MAREARHVNIISGENVMEKTMLALKFSARFMAGSCLSAALAFNAMAQPAPAFEPKVGQRGKDVVWVPTPQPTVERMLDMAKVTPQDYLMDLGSGDGRTVITAAKRGATAKGIEYNPDMVTLSQKNAQAAGLTAKATFEKADLFQSDFSKATVITMFLLPSINMQLRPKILDLKAGTRIVSNTFTMDDWMADETATIESTPNGERCESWCTALLWIVPAKVDGTWKAPSGALTFSQVFQNVTGTLGAQQLANGKLRGDQISFTVGTTQYTGRVVGNIIEGTMTAAGKSTPWRATR